MADAAIGVDRPALDLAAGGPVTTPGWVSEMLQQMAAESTGTAAPIHLQGEPMPLAPMPNPDAVPGHSISITTHGHGNEVDSWAECECGWRGTTHRNVASAPAGNYGARRDGAAHAAQFKAPEPEQAHLQAYSAKRAEWLQAQHDGVVAEKALMAAKRAAREARDVCATAAQHVDDTRASIDNLQGELLALVKGEQ